MRLVGCVFCRVSILYEDDNDDDDDDDNNNKPPSENSCSKDKIVKITSQTDNGQYEVAACMYFTSTVITFLHILSVLGWHSEFYICLFNLLAPEFYV
jgi:hypothetical protein